MKCSFLLAMFSFLVSFANAQNIDKQMLVGQWTSVNDTTEGVADYTINVDGTFRMKMTNEVPYYVLECSGTWTVEQKAGLSLITFRPGKDNQGLAVTTR